MFRLANAKDRIDVYNNATRLGERVAVQFMNKFFSWTHTLYSSTSSQVIDTANADPLKAGISYGFERKIR